MLARHFVNCTRVESVETFVAVGLTLMLLVRAACVQRSCAVCAREALYDTVLFM